LIELPDQVVDATDEVMKGARAIVALTFAEPGCWGSSYQDCVDIFSEQSASPTSAQQTLRTAADKYSEWRRRVAVFWSEAADDSAIAAAYKSRLEQWASDATISKDLLKDTIKDIDAWSKKLRRGGLDNLVGRMTDWAKGAWARSGHAEAEVDTDVLRSCVEALAKISTDKAVTTIVTALATKSAAVARDSALAKFMSLVENFRPDTNVGALVDVADAALVVDGLQKSEGLLLAMHNFRGFMCSALSANLQSAARFSDSEMKVLQAAETISQLFAAALQDTSMVSDKTKNFLIGYRLAIQLKSVVSDLVDELGDNGTGATLFPKYFKNLKEWQQYDDMHKEGNQEISKIKSYMGDVVADIADRFRAAADTVVKGVLVDMARAKTRLDKVAGGTDNGGNWKKEIEHEPSLTSERMVAACKVVEQAFCTAIESRTAELRKATWQTQDLSLRISCFCSNVELGPKNSPSPRPKPNRGAEDSGEGWGSFWDQVPRCCKNMIYEGLNLASAKRLSTHTSR